MAIYVNEIVVSYNPAVALFHHDIVLHTKRSLIHIQWKGGEMQVRECSDANILVYLNLETVMNKILSRHDDARFLSTDQHCLHRMLRICTTLIKSK